MGFIFIASHFHVPSELLAKCLIKGGLNVYEKEMQHIANIDL